MACCRPLPPADVPDDDTAVVVVEPDPPPDPEPEPPLPVSGTPCERSCARRGQLACSPVVEGCVAACDAYEAQGAAFSWQPECQAAAASCAAWDRCATAAR